MNKNLLEWCQENGKLGQIIMSQWDEDKNYEYFGKIISEYPPHGRAKVWWKCDKGHSFEAQISNRTSNKGGCPICSGKIVLKGYNDLLSYCKKENTEFTNRLIEEWDYIENKKEKLFIDEVTAYSNKKVHWICSICKHRWTTTICARVSQQSSCSKCNTSGTSLPEQYIYWSFKKYFNDTSNREKINNYELDIYIPSERFAIEFGSNYYHQDRTDRDKEKIEMCQNNNIKIITIYSSSNNEDEVYSENTIIYKEKDYVYYSKLKGYIKKILKENFNIEQSLEEQKEAFENAQKYSKGMRLNSISETHPLLLKEWDYERNIKMPECYGHACIDKVNWICSNCHERFMANINDRCNKSSACPYCGYSVTLDKINERTAKKGVSRKKKDNKYIVYFGKNNL